MTDSSEERSRRRRWPWILGGACILLGLWHLVADRYPEEEKELRRQIRQSVQETFPEEKAQLDQTFGLFPFDESGPEAPDPAPLPGRVILVHGLDDPGLVWQVLAPALKDQGFEVWLLHYPNDQPVDESAELFFEELLEFDQGAGSVVSIVAHSMGGLVSRELLTSPEIDYASAVAERRAPRVATLIMVGTPNHGSQLARFQLLTEVRDQLVRLSEGHGSWLGAILDGAGEAKIDLLPGSKFLSQLNDRPHPTDVDMLVIAGVASPWSEQDINTWMGGLRRDSPRERQAEIDALGESMIGMTHGWGDGLVTVESTRLRGIPHRTVNGTHLSIIRNVAEGSVRVPPAVPIIVERLSPASERPRAGTK